ncbi:uncharacterized protein LOC141680221 [Apium graveolens]|uniref:uncharacterized protein LOC141680221 n=1 Tax=Apium graveolens TaxID=4045 RepID=UPI003D796FA6
MCKCTPPENATNAVGILSGGLTSPIRGDSLGATVHVTLRCYCGPIHPLSTGLNERSSRILLAPASPSSQALLPTAYIGWIEAAIPTVWNNKKYKLWIKSNCGPNRQERRAVAEGKINYQLLRKDFKSRGGKYVSCRSASSLVSRHCIKSFETSYFLSLFGGGHEKETAHALQQRASMIDFLSSLLSSACRFRSLVSSGGENKLSTTPERFQIWRRKIRQLPISFQSRHCITSFETSDFLSLFGSGQEKETAHALQERASVIYFFSSLVSLQIQISGHKRRGK